jgi:glycyl-tRNA synthetase beta chain
MPSSGTQFERVERIEKLAGEIAGQDSAPTSKSKRAAKLAKADLTTGVVGEFPELQGVMGRYYALHDKEDAAVADAIRDHYKPVGPTMPCRPTRSHCRGVGRQAGCLDWIFSAGENRLGPATHLRCAGALGVIRILLENKLRFRSKYRRLTFLLRRPSEGRAEGKRRPSRSDRCGVLYRPRR